MQNSALQQAEGKLHEAKGEAKEEAGKITHNCDLESEGRVEKIAGTVQRKLGELEQLFGK